MTNIAKALARLREDRRDAQNQVDKLAEAISVLEKLTRGHGGSYSGQGRAKRGDAAGFKSDVADDAWAAAAIDNGAAMD